MRNSTYKRLIVEVTKILKVMLNSFQFPYLKEVVES